MRTTLDLDDQVLLAARAKAAAEGISVGRAVSELVRLAISAPVEPVSGLRVVPAVPGHVITDELVREHRDDG
jgi:hypothetical protein